MALRVSIWPRLLRCVMAPVLLAPVLGAAAQQRPWPSVPVPEHRQAFEVGSHLKLNGLPVRVQGYVSDRSAAQLGRWLREQAGGQWVENRIGRKTVLGQRQGDFFITVELEPLPGAEAGTKVVTSIMDLASPGAAAPDRGSDAFGNWAARLPAASRVLSHLTDGDASHESLHLVAVNGQSQAFNARHFIREFSQLGYRHEPGEGAADTPQAQEKLAFSAPDTDAVVVLGRDERGRSTMVLIINRSKR